MKKNNAISHLKKHEIVECFFKGCMPSAAAHVVSVPYTQVIEVYRRIHAYIDTQENPEAFVKSVKEGDISLDSLLNNL